VSGWEISQVHAEFLSVLHVQRVLSVNEGALAALLLHFGNHLQRERGFAAGFWAIDFHHTAARQAAHAQRHIQTQGAGGDDLNVFNLLAFAQFHDRAFAKLLFNLRQGRLQGLGFFAVGGFDFAACDAGVHVEFPSKLMK
jgi:hypothetical protein